MLGSLPGIPLKPDPAALNGLLEQLGLDRTRGLYLGDTVMDIQCAKATGLYAVAAGWGFQTDEELLGEKPDRFIRQPAELTAIARQRFIR